MQQNVKNSFEKRRKREKNVKINFLLNDQLSVLKPFKAETAKSKKKVN